jgi:peptidoglycan/LPS O-acetylase OafA/YrhL
MIKPLTSLRFFFALCVFLSHYIINEKELFYEGYIGVEFFFILSGFIISYNYKQKFIDKKITRKEFIVARVARIYPLHIITFLFVLFLMVRGTFTSGTILPWKEILFNLTLLQSFVPVKSIYFSFNAVSWSISNELFFYIMFPVIINCICRWNGKTILAVCLLLLTAYFIAIIFIPEPYHHALFYINPFIRIIDFLIGIGLFCLWEYISNLNKVNAFKVSKKIVTLMEVGSVCLLILFVCLSKNIPQTYRYASFYWIPMSIIILCFAQPRGWVSALLSWKPLIIAGEVSFGFYMIHQQAIGIGRALIGKISIVMNVTVPVICEFLIIFSSDIFSLPGFLVLSCNNESNPPEL